MYGKYHWQTYKEMQKDVHDLASGLSQLGIKDRLYIQYISIYYITQISASINSWFR